MVLASSSPTLHSLLRKMNQQSQQNPAIFFPGINFADLANLVTFMYTGEVEVAEDRLDSFLKAAAELQVKGLVSGDQASGGAAKVHGSNGDVAKVRKTIILKYNNFTGPRRSAKSNQNGQSFQC